MKRSSGPKGRPQKIRWQSARETGEERFQTISRHALHRAVAVVDTTTVRTRSTGTVPS